ncbi:fatty acid desaturase-domain-containing protein [Lipomyces japonicus]|uniref:fatty acid desaturase-domain-containing protein n=1 Tax=Lipomyces japonicus TaxID=56871 RepID=UPI0034D02235
MTTNSNVSKSQSILHNSYIQKAFYLPISPASLPQLPVLDVDHDAKDDVNGPNHRSLLRDNNDSSLKQKFAPKENLLLEADKGLSDFLWTFQEEPHRTRRLHILKAHPEVTKLCGHEPLTKYIITAVVLLQFTIAYLLRNTSFFSLKFILTAYIIGATANQNVFLCIHELSHNLGFKKPLYNRLFAIFANLPIGIPYSAGFRPYHLIHHKHLGDTSLDTDIPTTLEALVLRNIAGKAFFATFQIFFYAIRPMCVMRVPFTYVHLLNIIAQVVVDYIVLKNFGGNALSYFILSSFFAGSLHPCAGHFIAEHYVFNVKPGEFDPAIPPPETYSYYGILNLFTYNVGLHNEHHDFPFIPWTRLPLLTQIAREYYEPLPRHESWVRVLWDFVLDENVSLWSRVKRDAAASKTNEAVLKSIKLKDTDNGDQDDEIHANILRKDKDK